MNKTLGLFSALLLLLNSCTRETSPVGLIPEEDRAPQFDSVSQFLDLGGVFYAYIDLTNEMENVAETLNEIAQTVKHEIPQIPSLPLDINKVMEVSGLSGLDAIGLSSREIGGGLYHNRSILYFPKGVTGFFKFFGDTPHPFDSLDFAPSSADLVAEMSYRPEVLRDTFLEISDSLAGALGRGMIASQLHSPIPEIGNRTANELIESAGNRFIVILDFDNEEQLSMGMAGTFPRTEALVAFDGITTLLQSMRPAIEQQHDLEWLDTDTGFEIRSARPFPAPFDYLQPIIVADTQTERAFLASSQSYLDQCLQNGDKLKDTPEFKEAANMLPPEGVYFSYVSSEYAETVLGVFTSSMEMNPLMGSEFSSILEMLVPQNDKGIATVTTVGPEGLYSASNLNISHRTTVTNLAIQPAAFVIGMTSAMAIPAYSSVRVISQEKTILNNLRMISSGGQQYMLENGVTEAAYSDIVGDYISPVQSVDGEDYSGLVVTQDNTPLSVTTFSGTTIQYPESTPMLPAVEISPTQNTEELNPGLSGIKESAMKKSIMNNLRQIVSGGQMYMLENGVVEAPYSVLVGEFFTEIPVVDGEDYSQIVVKPTGTVSVTTESGYTVEYAY